MDISHRYQWLNFFHQDLKYGQEWQFFYNRLYSQNDIPFGEAVGVVERANEPLCATRIAQIYSEKYKWPAKVLALELGIFDTKIDTKENDDILIGLIKNLQTPEPSSQ